MKVEQIYTGCLAQGAYYIQSNGEAAIIDPLREVEPYLQKAKEDGVKIKYIFETHFHADFVSGHLTLSEKTNAPIIFGPNANPKFDAHIAADEEIFEIGNVKLKVLHTPGHTKESSCYLLYDAEGNEHSIFTGDTLFLGDVGRPDLAQKSDEITMEDLAAYAYESLRNKIMPLPDHIIVYPAHGAGSACGKNMMKETFDTLGNQKKMNYALRADMTKEEFIKELTEDLLPPPGYFPLNVKMNKEGYDSIDMVIAKGNKALSPEEFEMLANERNALVLDLRSKFDFSTGHIPNSIFIGLDGSFAPWVGELIVDVKQAILLVTPEGREEETITRLARVGFDNTLGYLIGGIEAWEEKGKEIETLESITANTLELIFEKEKDLIFDVRKESEYEAEHLENVKNIPLSNINQHLNEFPKYDKFFVHCASGYRSVIAASILKSRGYSDVVNVQGGFKAVAQTKIPLTKFVCPSNLNTN